MISIHLIRKLSKYKSASWAVWTNNFDELLADRHKWDDIIPYIKDNIEIFRNDIIFIGLNRSGGGKYTAHDDTNYVPPFHNFHTVGHRGDNRLYRYIQQNSLNNLQYTYMTDIDKDTVEADSKKVMLNKKDHAKVLWEQINLLGANKLKIICFGSKTFSYVVKRLSNNNGNYSMLEKGIKHKIVENIGKRFDIYGVWHYTDRGFNHKYVVKLEEQLRHLNEIFMAA